MYELSVRWLVIGLDASESMIAKARQQFPALDFRLGDATNFELSRPFDAVFSNAVLHWITDFEAAIRQIRKHLKPGGRFVAGAPAKKSRKGKEKEVKEEVVVAPYGDEDE